MAQQPSSAEEGIVGAPLRESEPAGMDVDEEMPAQAEEASVAAAPHAGSTGVKWEAEGGASEAVAANIVALGGAEVRCGPGWHHWDAEPLS